MVQAMSVISRIVPPCFRAPSTTSGSQPNLQLQTYRFNHKRRGKAIIINNRNFDQRLTGQMEREGTDVDASSLESTFLRLGLDVIRYDNLTTLDMSMNLREGKDLFINANTV